MSSPYNDLQYFLWEYKQLGVNLSETDNLCYWCNKKLPFVTDLVSTKHYCCEKCFKKNKRYYSTITQAEAFTQYGLKPKILKKYLDDHTICCTTIKTRNQLKANLYYRFQLKKIMLEIYGSEDNWHKIKEDLEDKQINSLMQKLSGNTKKDEPSVSDSDDISDCQKKTKKHKLETIELL